MPEQYKPIQIANYFLSKYGEDNELSQMKLQKLVYLAYGWWLAYKDEPLMSQKPEVWQYGPVFQSLYSRLKPYGSSSIREPHTMPFEEEESVEGVVVENFLDWIWNRYKGYSASMLSDMTHKKDTPWQKIAEQHNYRVSPNLAMDDDLIKLHYKHLKDAMTQGE